MGVNICKATKIVKLNIIIILYIFDMKFVCFMSVFNKTRCYREYYTQKLVNCIIITIISNADCYNYVDFHMFYLPTNNYKDIDTVYFYDIIILY